ncbi:hypothetical protein ACSU1N_06330 [Thermogladius sp. 4427co]|uniref:hypothetical protein n=1 Tax=Thermogladius sp. 4427co TaxID=3450718 RepID=UPI003F792F7A
MNRSLFLLPLLVIAIITPLMTPVALSQTAKKVTVMADLAHGESDKYLNYIIGNITFVNWVVNKDPITPDKLANVDILLIGQPTVAFSADEINAIINWLDTGNKALWVGGDSDYGNGYQTIQIVNNLMAAIGSKLRLEQGAVYSNYNGTYSYGGSDWPVTAKAYYRMLAFVEPDNRPDLFTQILTAGITKPILMHGPDCVIWVDSSGKYHDPVTDIAPDLIRLVLYHYAHIGVNYANWAPLVYDPLKYSNDNNTFVAYMAEYWSDKNDIIVLSGESIYGDYEPAWSSMYYGIPLDGPRWVTNFIAWLATIITSRVTTTVTVTQTVTSTTTATTTVSTTYTTTTTSPVTTTIVDWTTTGIISGVLVLVIIIEAVLLATRKPKK